MSQTLYDKNGLTVGVFAGPAATAVDGDRRRVQIEIHGRDYGEVDRAYLELPLREALAMLRDVLDAINPLELDRRGDTDADGIWMWSPRAANAKPNRCSTA